MKMDNIVRSTIDFSQLRPFVRIGVATLSILLLVYVVMPAFANAQTAAVQRGKGFLTPAAAADALIAAADTYDTNELKAILGPDSNDIISTGEPVVDRDNAAKFATLAKAKKEIAMDPRIRTRAYLNVGEEDWPFPVPLVKQGGKWFFDTKAGKQEILYRRIGGNELDAIQVCRGYVEAQNDYALEKHDGALVNQYAQRIISTPGKHDGLAWQNPDGTWGGTVGEKAAKEIERTYTGTPAPYHGYYFKILKGQGAAAPLGKLDYMIKGAMIGGFALIAYPATYKVTGVKTFMVSQDGVVYEKDLGPNTVQLAKSIDLFNPDLTWSPVSDDQ
jgi:DUF2950 family protein